MNSDSSPETGKNLINSRYGLIRISAFLLFITFTIYLPSLKNGFVWDDADYIYENDHIKAIDLNFFKWSLTDSAVGHWHPVTWFSLAMDYAVWGLNPFGYHLSNILFHSLNTFLVFILAVRLVRFKSTEIDNNAIITGIVASILFGIHPLHVESVAWVTERKDVLSTLFFLIAIISYTKYASTKGAKKTYYVACLSAYILALMTKPMVISLPVVLLILDFYPLKRLALREDIKQVLIEKLPLFALSILSAIITVWAAHSGEALRDMETYPLSIRFFVAVRSIAFYLTKMLLPFNLAPFYPYPGEVVVFTLEYMGALLLFITVTLFCIRLRNRSGLFLSVWLYYLVTLMPVIGIVQAGGQAAADRYTYIPSLGPFLLCGLVIGALFEKSSDKHFQAIVIAVLTLLSGILATRTMDQTAIWHDSITFWSHDIKIFPSSTPRGYYNRGVTYHYKDNYQLALMDYNKAIEINHKYADAYNNRGDIYYILGNYQMAIKDFSKVIEIDPDNADAYFNLGNAYNRIGNYKEAVERYTRAIEINPRHEKAYNKLRIAYDNLANYQKAVPISP